MNRSVLVTGASRGIGAAAARAFAEAGDRVAVHYSASPDAAEQVLQGLPGSVHLMVQADLADPAAIEAMVDDAARALGSIDVLVNNAGVYHPHRIRETTYAEWQRAWADTLAVNLVGTANVTWCAVRHMGRGGRVVHVGSRGGLPGGAARAGLRG